MGWTDYASISIWSPIIAAALFGYGVITLFISVYMYIIVSKRSSHYDLLQFLTAATSGLLRRLCCFCAELRHFYKVFCSWRIYNNCCALVRESGCALYFDDIGLHQCGHGTCTFRYACLSGELGDWD